MERATSPWIDDEDDDELTHTLSHTPSSSHDDDEEDRIRVSFSAFRVCVSDVLHVTHTIVRDVAHAQFFDAHEITHIISAIFTLFAHANTKTMRAIVQ